jgi:hypothetical protein
MIRAPFLAVLLASVTMACGPEQPVTRSATMPSIAFDSMFRLARTFTPEQPDSVPLGLVSGVHVARNGDFVIADVRSSRVTRYDANGRLLAVLGRGGRGPGEFLAPMFPVVDRHGRVHVMDMQQPRISVFGADGTLLRTVSTSTLGRVGEFAVLPGGDYLMVAWSHGGRELLIRTDSLGSRISASLPHAQIRPEGQPDFPVWGNVRNASLAVAEGRAFVVSSLSDSLWTVDLPDGEIRATRITPPGYAAPVAPRENMSNPKAFSRWADSWTTTSLVRASDRGTLVIFVRGVLMRGDSAVAAYRGPQGAWQGLTGAPVVLAMRSDTVVALMDPNADKLQFGLYVRR